MSHTVIAFGEILWDLLPSGPTLGGAPLNLAYRLTELGERAIPVSRLGRDSNGEKAFEHMTRQGIETTCLQWHESKPTGTVPLTLDSEGRPNFTIVPDVAFDYIEFTDKVSALAASCDCICFGTLIQRAPVSRQTLLELLGSTDCLKFLDVNLRRDCYTAESIHDSLAAADIVKLNQDEMSEVDYLLGRFGMPPPDAAQRLLELFELRCLLVTFGEKGALALSETGEKQYFPGYRVAVADTVGSGDACSAGFLHYWLAGATPAEACFEGNLLGALAATKPGGTAPISRDEIMAFKSQTRERLVEPQLARYGA